MAAFRSLLHFSLVRHVLKLRSTAICGRRTLLSPAYQCSSVWEARRQNPILKDLDMCKFRFRKFIGLIQSNFKILDDFIAEIQRQTQRGHTISATDIDVVSFWFMFLVYFGDGIKVFEIRNLDFWGTLRFYEGFLGAYRIEIEISVDTFSLKICDLNLGWKAGSNIFL